MNTKEKFFKELNKFKSKTNLSKAKGKMHKINLSQIEMLMTLAEELNTHIEYLRGDFERELESISSKVISEYEYAEALYDRLKPRISEIKEALETLGVEDDSVNYAEEVITKWDEKADMSIDFFYDKLK
tara:strand:+ start:243 stop:629 length:387 start_codon:yes stop_codon:yes gene_type:complete